MPGPVLRRSARWLLSTFPPKTAMLISSLLSALAAALPVAASPPPGRHMARDGESRPVRTHTPTFTFAELYGLVDNFLHQFVFNNTAQVKSIKSTILAPDVIGRVDVTRNFVGQELNTEYIFGLFSQIALNPQAFTMLGTPKAYAITHFTANQNIAATAAIVQFYTPFLNATFPAEIDFWTTWNAKGQISQYDATFRWLQWNFDAFAQAAMQQLGILNATQFETLLVQKLASSICTTAAQSCNGTNTQYNSTAACVSYLTTQVPLGQAYQAGFNTLVCRMIHQPMVPFRPSVHCPHIGPTGGGMCADDRTYAGNVLEPLFTTQPFVPNGYANRNATIAAM